ncbi:peroxiredoxin-like family protein [Mechercharimyces sp. CAU 1602]|uniref:peroxiredoxin-like family protein n=1 Tax=Mechercharimyces sp. CAU 1602 TaxID=2973933 RepID=UPI0021632EB5|nr:peroxiredoxin-like family protein [Mechercharimyces sp. CAU 1602]MCS1349989.1 AhpC/TSA family protein [Mechercharimyces sp. CAU 1602]
MNTMTSLKESLERVKKAGAKKLPAEIKENMARATKELTESAIAKGLQAGEKAPNFTLKNAIREEITLYEQLQSGPVVLLFYRGEWCPYCNLELQAYQQMTPQFRESGIQILAISPETPDHSLSVKEKHTLSFEVLSDPTRQVINNYKLLFQLPDYLVETYQKAGIDLKEYNMKDDAWHLPVPATYIIAPDGTIDYVEADPDYTSRMEPQKALERAQRLKR